MIIEYVTIRMGRLEKEYRFSRGNNLIHSQNNSVGKTTLLRVILYSLGYSVPGTKNFPLDHYEVETLIETDRGKEIRLVRNSPFYIIRYEGNDAKTYCLPEQLHELHAQFFYTQTIDILNNLLGVFYLDQEKGWTLLNRGVVIGSIHFNVEDFIQGLSGRDCSDLKRRKTALEVELNKYEQITNVAKYKESLETAAGSILKENPDDELDSQIEKRQIELNVVNGELARIDRILNSNKQVRRYIDEMQLMVQLPDGDLFRVKSENVVGLNDSIDYLIAKRRIKAVECNKLLASLSLLREKKKQRTEEMFTVDSIADAFDEMVQKFPYGYSKVERIKDNLKKQLSEVRKQISERTTYNNKVVKSLYANIIRYAKELDVGDENTIRPNYLFTSNLKVLSGALLHKTVFSFRLAFVLEVKKILGVKLPIILDSPSGKEVDASNIQKMISILNRDFYDHQIIVASIFEYELSEVSRIEIMDRLFDV